MPHSKARNVVASDDNKVDFNELQKEGASINAEENELNKVENTQPTGGRLLAGYHLGAKLRRLRLRKKLGLVDLGKHTGLSASMLSQLENGKAVPTLPTLERIAMVFDIGLDYFFDSQRSRRTFAITRARERLQFPDRADNPTPAYFFEVLASAAKEKPICAYIAEFPPRKSDEVQEHFHQGWELLHVLAGTLAIRFGSEEHLLETGDSVYFDAAEPHAYRSDSETPARAIVITPRLEV